MFAIFKRVQSPKTVFLWITTIHISVNVAFGVFSTVANEILQFSMKSMNSEQVKEGNDFCKKTNNHFVHAQIVCL